MIGIVFWHKHGFSLVWVDARNLLNSIWADIMHLKRYVAQNRSLPLLFERDLYTRWCYVQKEFSQYGCIFEKFSSWIPLSKENYFFYLSHFGRLTSYKYSCHALQNYNPQSSVRSALIATCCGQYCRNIILPYKN